MTYTGFRRTFFALTLAATAVPVFADGTLTTDRFFPAPAGVAASLFPAGTPVEVSHAS